MTTYRRPGTYVEEVALAQSVTSQSLETSYAAFVGLSLRGPVDAPSFVASWSDFTKRYGQFRSASGLQTYDLALAVYQFFSNGGRGAWIQRLVGTGAQNALVTFNDSGAQAVLNVTAIDPGDWAVGNLYAQVSQVDVSGSGGVAQPGDTFTLTIYSGGTKPGYVVESWPDLSLDPTSSRFASTVVNGSSSWVTLSVPQGATGTLPPVMGVPTALANPTGVTGTLDGAAPTADAYVASADAFDSTPSNLIFNVPDAYHMAASDASNIYNAFLLKADDRGDAFVVVDVPAEVETTPANALTWVNGIDSTGNGAAYYPSLEVLNPVSGTSGTIKVAPGGAVIGVYHATDNSRGVYKTPAGTTASIGNAVDVSVYLSSSQLDDANTATKPLNIIRVIPGAGICIMGGRTLGGTRDVRYVGSRRALLEIKKALNERLQFALFENNDYRLRTKVVNTLGNYLNLMWQQGGLAGTSPDQGFYVTCDDTNNSATDISNGLLTVEVGVALQVPTEFVVLRIGQFDGSTTVSDSSTSSAS